MAFDTKSMLTLLANNIAKSKTLKEAYAAVMDAANVEGVNLPTYEDKMAELEELRKE